jgi:hypothetical protein
MITHVTNVGRLLSMCDITVKFAKISTYVRHAIDFVRDINIVNQISRKSTKGNS